MKERVPEEALDHYEILRRGGANGGDEDWALFRCPACGTVYLMDYEVETVFLDPLDLSRRIPVYSGSFDCLGCGVAVPGDEPWIGPNADDRFAVSWNELNASPWKWVAGPKWRAAQQRVEPDKALG